MGSDMYPVDVISLCSNDGKIQPLRMRMDNSGSQKLRVDICEIIDSKYLSGVGTEAQIFLCRAKIGQIMCTFNLKYVFRSHTWWVGEAVQDSGKA